MLPNGYIVRDVLLGKGGVASGFAAGSIAVDMSSSSPVGTRELSADLSKRGFPLVDAPVSGGVKKASDGTLAIMVGGEANPMAQVKPVLEVMGKVFTTGASGTGHAMKALNNFLSAANLAVAAEAVMAVFCMTWFQILVLLGARTGSSASVIPELINEGESNFFGLDPKDGTAARDDIVSASLVVPVNQPVLFTNASKDVGHSLLIPELRLQQDFVPGLIIPVHFTATGITKTEIVCTQLCGLGHYNMRAYVEVLSKDDYAKWLTDQAGQ